jgi:hypothetical protein
MIDITEIPGLFRLFTFRLAVVLDVFSRIPLAAQFFTNAPTAEQMATLVLSAASKHTPPKHFVSDQGSQFTSQISRCTLASLGIKHRFGAIGQSGSIAMIERFWRTMKEMCLLKTRPPLAPDDLYSRLHAGLHYYGYHKPHQGINGATPAELYYGKTPACTNATRPSRAYEKKSDHKLFDIAYLDPDRLLPLLIPNTAAASPTRPALLIHRAWSARTALKLRPNSVACYSAIPKCLKAAQSLAISPVIEGHLDRTSPRRHPSAR